MLAGAVVATALQQPLIVFPVALLSHFALDALPHFGIYEHDPHARNRHPLFHYVVAIDVALLLSLLVLLPSVLRGEVSRWVLLGGMVLAWIPDAVWIGEFLQMRKVKDYARRNVFVRFHQYIQWFEKPWGLVTEVVWFGAMAVLLGTLAQ